MRGIVKLSIVLLCCIISWALFVGIIYLIYLGIKFVFNIF
jgi:hypothetical protein